MDKYVKSPQVQEKSCEPNEIRLPLHSSRISPSIEHGLSLFAKGEESVFIKAVGSKLVPKAIFVTEILKHRIAGLHQNTEVGTTDVVTVYLPKEEGLDKVELVKPAPFIKITLSKTPLDKSSPGYQAPLPENLVHPRAAPSTGTSSNLPGSKSDEQTSPSGENTRRRGGFRGGRGGRGRGGRGRRGGFRGGRGGSSSPSESNTESTTSTTTATPTENTEHSESRGEFTGRGRGGFRGRGRGRGGSRGGRGRGGFRGRGRGGFRGGFRGDSNGSTPAPSS